MVGYDCWHIRLRSPLCFFPFFFFSSSFHSRIYITTVTIYYHIYLSQTDKYILPFLWEPWILFGWAHYPSGIKVSQVTSGYEPVFVLASVVNPMSPDIRFIFGVGSF
ncbi:hypothetical protein N7455_011909 [Penicillium solitum]|uniref:uncharacterized protein n=1 Tax=Penicillium solitum TaxID=60172 RepID=UPI0032C4A18E|nr:hypothetical protein N7455_011909 [Penicillium solitum]